MRTDCQREGSPVPLSMEEVEHVAWLARLALTDEEKRVMAEQLGRILDYMEKLRELDTADVPPTFHALEGMRVPLREDRPRPGLDREEALAAAPDRSGDFFRVPRVGEAEVEGA